MRGMGILLLLTSDRLGWYEGYGYLLVILQFLTTLVLVSLCVPDGSSPD